MTKTRTPRRNTEQNRAYWGRITELASLRNEDKSTAHESVLQGFHGLRTITLPDGTRERVAKHRSKHLSEARFDELIGYVNQLIEGVTA